MLEKRKEWCQERIKRGKAWIEKNRFEIGFGLGAATLVAIGLIAEKVFEPKEIVVQTGHNEKIEDRNFLLRVTAIDRFGGEHPSPWARFENGDEDKERIIKAIDAGLNGLKNCEF